MNIICQNRWFRLELELEIYRDEPPIARYHVVAPRFERALRRQLWREFRAATRGRPVAEGTPT